MKLLSQLSKRTGARPKTMSSGARKASIVTPGPALDFVSAIEAIHRQMRGNWDLAISSESQNRPKLAATNTEHLCDADNVTLRVAKSSAEVEQLRDVWTLWNRHPNCDIDSFLLANHLRRETMRPHVVVVYREGRVDCILVGRLQKGRMSFSMGGARILLPQAHTLHFLYEGFLGNQSVENSNILVQGIIKSLHDGDADVAELTGLRLDSPLYRAARHLPNVLCRDNFPVT